MLSVVQHSFRRAVNTSSTIRRSTQIVKTGGILNSSITSTMDSQKFSSTSKDGITPPKNFHHFLNEKSLKRQPSLIRELTKLFASAEPGTIFMAGGLPNPDLFPYTSFSLQIDEKTSINLSSQELRLALQYQPTMGHPELHEELTKLVQRCFPPPHWDNTGLIVTVGSQNALHGMLEIILEVGDPVVIPNPCYSSTLSIMDPYSPTYLAVPEDSDGMQPDALRSALQNWYGNNSPSQSDGNEKVKPGFKRPKILYVNPTGANPSGIVIPTERKKEIYRIAQEYNLLILEDDPYYFLHFLQEDPTTFLSMDVDGRVIRFDSFSKVLSSGIRVGFATGPKNLIRSLEMYLQASILHAASLSQVVVNGTLRNWGNDGFRQHMETVKAFYRKRRDLMLEAAEKHLTGLAEWSTPNAGMFLWLKIRGVDDTFDMVMERGIQRKIMALPGREFMADKSKPCPYIRVSYSVIPEDQIEQGISRLAELIRDEQKLTQK
ncbi:Kynurenine/alpha-aminoadipate aminotransferase, mitochondrial [Orchesella cincta]|uniref:Kynurenine/alpha-aminoadipate aminotransferase, mitochondrial n=1 Tax=Orchesella cincta TaxID=48709 RepID=A0A1D2NBY8_ORCCI|nr:Kynurenine/alpha-aminoadipate aminotransferase, mitochondrial [Orchesella cincta]